MGSLTIRETVAQTDFSNKRIFAPSSKIEFQDSESENNSFIQYAASVLNCDHSEAASAFESYCKDLKANAARSSAIVEGIGSFSVDNNGHLQFTGEKFPVEFLLPVTAERVIRKHTMHEMLVGDKQTTNVQMAEYFSETEKKKDHWWVWAIVLTVAGILGLLFYFQSTETNDAFGNAIKILNP
jgi:hypothetical protein